MTGTQTLVARAALGAAGALASIALTGWQRLRDLPARTFDYGITAVFALSRVGLFVLIFAVLHLAPRGDIPAFYFPQAKEILRHHLPYRNFASSYAPLHPYLDAVFVAVRRTPLAIIFASILGELLLFPLWLRLGRLLVEESTLRNAALLYLASPISLQFVTVDGQDNVLIALLLTTALWFALHERVFVSGALLGLSAATIKFLPLLYAPAFFVVLPRRLRWASGVTLVLAMVYGGAMRLHLPVQQPLTAEGAMRSAGNLPYLLESIFAYTIPGRVSDLILLTVLVLIFGVIARSVLHASTLVRLRALTFGICALTCALLLFSKKSWPPYLMMCLFPLCLLSSESGPRLRWRLWLFGFFGFVAVTEQSIWSSLLGEAPSLRFRATLLAGSLPAQLLLGAHVLLLAGYGWLLHESLSRLRPERNK